MNEILIGNGEKPVHLLAKYGNRHGLIAGATGTGKTVSLLVLAEGFSRLGVPVFMADVKGDVAGLALPGASSDKVRTAIAAAGAARIQLSAGQPKAIDRLIRGEVPAAVLTLLYPETGFPEFAGFKIFRIPLGPSSPTARL